VAARLRPIARKDDMKIDTPRALRTLFIAGAAVLLASCNDYEDDYYGDDPLSCSATDQKAWLGAYMDDWYFWYKISPRPSPGAYSNVDDYYFARLYTGTDANFPADRWSYVQSTADFDRFYGAGQTLGYGVAVAGAEVAGQPNDPLYVRYVEAKSDAAARGVVRGDQIVSIDGRTSAELITADDYSVLTPASAGQTLTLKLRNNGVDRTVVVTAAVYSLTPVPAAAVVTSPLGRKMGYVVVKDMIDQATAPLETAFAQFKAAGIDDVVLDLRYNGGGLVSVGRLVASYVAGTRGSGQIYASLLYNDRQAAYYNQVYGFNSSLSSAAGVGRVYVLTGPRTCSASEQVINGLRGIGVDVVAIGDTTCGKPVGFRAIDGRCGSTYAAVNFESANQANEGRYFDGFAPTCGVVEDFSEALGAAAEPLLAAARGYADTQACPLATPTARPLGLAKRSLRRNSEPGERQDMLAR
jgi:hypothetical protein